MHFNMMSVSTGSVLSMLMCTVIKISLIFLEKSFKIWKNVFPQPFVKNQGCHVLTFLNTIMPG